MFGPVAVVELYDSVEDLVTDVNSVDTGLPGKALTTIFCARTRRPWG